MNKGLLTVLTPSYEQVYVRELASQRDYAARHGYRRHVDRLLKEDAAQAKWRKVEALLEMLDRHEVVLLLDADCIVGEDAPDICQELRPGKSVYMARGHSGRYNSGVILAKGDEDSRRFFRAVLASKDARPRLENFVSEEGENGHVIEAASNPLLAERVHELSYRWNNNRYIDRSDYIRHFSGGPMKEHRRRAP